MIAAILGRIGDGRGRRQTTGGCPFLNAAVRVPRPGQPRAASRSLRGARGTTTLLRQLLAEDGDPTPSVTASLLVALSDGLLEIAYLDDPESVASLVREALARLLVRG